MKKLNEIKKENKEKLDKAKKIVVAFSAGILVGHAIGTREAIDKLLQNKWALLGLFLLRENYKDYYEKENNKRRQYYVKKYNR